MSASPSARVARLAAFVLTCGACGLVATGAAPPPACSEIPGFKFQRGVSTVGSDIKSIAGLSSAAVACNMNVNCVAFDVDDHGMSHLKSTNKSTTNPGGNYTSTCSGIYVKIGDQACPPTYPYYVTNTIHGWNGILCFSDAPSAAASSGVDGNWCVLKYATNSTGYQQLTSLILGGLGTFCELPTVCSEIPGFRLQRGLSIYTANIQSVAGVFAAAVACNQNMNCLAFNFNDHGLSVLKSTTKTTTTPSGNYTSTCSGSYVKISDRTCPPTFPYYVTNTLRGWNGTVCYSDAQSASLSTGVNGNWCLLKSAANSTGYPQVSALVAAQLGIMCQMPTACSEIPGYSLQRGVSITGSDIRSVSGLFLAAVACNQDLKCRAFDFDDHAMSHLKSTNQSMTSNPAGNFTSTCSGTYVKISNKACPPAFPYYVTNTIRGWNDILCYNNAQYAATSNGVDGSWCALKSATNSTSYQQLTFFISRGQGTFCVMPTGLSPPPMKSPSPSPKPPLPAPPTPAACLIPGYSLQTGVSTVGSDIQSIAGLSSAAVACNQNLNCRAFDVDDHGMSHLKSTNTSMTNNPGGNYTSICSGIYIKISNKACPPTFPYYVTNTIRGWNDILCFSDAQSAAASSGVDGNWCVLKSATNSTGYQQLTSLILGGLGTFCVMPTACSEIPGYSLQRGVSIVGSDIQSIAGLSSAAVACNQNLNCRAFDFDDHAMSHLKSTNKSMTNNPGGNYNYTCSGIYVKISNKACPPAYPYFVTNTIHGWNDILCYNNAQYAALSNGADNSWCALKSATNSTGYQQLALFVSRGQGTFCAMPTGA